MRLQHKSGVIIAVLSVVIILTTLFSGNAFETPSTLINNAQNSIESKSLFEVNLSGNSTIIPHTIIKDELSLHASISDCWVAYKGRVYDITKFLPKHPGTAQAILPFCGNANEFEAAFTKKHGTAKANLLMKVGVFMGDFSVKGGVV